MQLKIFCFLQCRTSIFFHFALCKAYTFKYQLVYHAYSTYGLKLKIVFRYSFFMQMKELLEMNNVFVRKQNACIA